MDQNTNNPITLMQIPQGPSSRLDADTLDGFQTSPANNPSPNTLVALDQNKKFPTSVMPGVSGTFKSADATPKIITVVNGIITAIV
jgi:hypothetical protein